MRFNKLLLCAAAGIAASFAAAPAQAQDYYTGTIITVGQPFCPYGWVVADGQVLQIERYNALFSLFGTTYGGNGTTTFGVPDLRGRSPIGSGQGYALTRFAPGDKGGVEKVQLTVGQMPMHSHAVMLFGASGPPDSEKAKNSAPATFPAGTNMYRRVDQPDVPMARDAIRIGTAGSAQAFPMRSPYLALTFCVATDGIFPSQG
ncbi:MAG: tail fiber protein [Pseudomonadota bacterium]